MTKGFLSAAIVLVLAAPAVAQESAPRLVTMTGSASVQAEPDRAWVNVGVEGRAPSPAPARQYAASTMKAIQARLKGLGIPETAIRTSQFNVMQDWAVAQGQRTPRGYVVSNVVEIRVDDITKVAAVIDESIAAGANVIHGVRWDMTNRDALERRALQLAYEDARMRAQVIAQAAGLKLGEVYAAHETGAIMPMTASTGNALMRQSAAASNISPGEMGIAASVTVSFRLER